MSPQCSIILYFIYYIGGSYYLAFFLIIIIIIILLYYIISKVARASALALLYVPRHSVRALHLQGETI